MMSLSFLTTTLVITLAFFPHNSLNCENEFHGFGVHLGSIDNLNTTNEAVVQKIIDTLYMDLQIRHFRISYESYFSPTPNVYTLSCSDELCTWSWESILKIISNKERYPNITLFASIWSPPLYMMDMDTVKLKPEYEMDYYYFIKNITNLIYDKYNLTIEQVSPVNEPENIFATWEHCNMDPIQLCNLIHKFNDSNISMCPENSYFWVSKIYLNYQNANSGQKTCKELCRTIITHSYAPNLNISSPNFGLAYYDLESYEPIANSTKPIWMTEVSSTYYNPALNQMNEAIDFGTNIINFVGTTCIEKYYYWLAFTNGPSGESLIWGNITNNELQSLVYPKKFYVYKQFTTAIGPNSEVMKKCSLAVSNVKCLQFSNSDVTIFINPTTRSQSIGKSNCTKFCCTTDEVDYSCNMTLTSGKSLRLPSRSVCSCFAGSFAEIPEPEENPPTTTQAQNSNSAAKNKLGSLVSKLVQLPIGYFYVFDTVLRFVI